MHAAKHVDGGNPAFRLGVTLDLKAKLGLICLLHLTWQACKKVYDSSVCVIMIFDASIRLLQDGWPEIH